MRVLTRVDGCVQAKEELMDPSEDVGTRSPGRSTARPGRLARGLLLALLFAAGAIVAGAVARTTPAAADDCVPTPLVCVTTSVPSLPAPTVSVPFPTTTDTTTPGTTQTGTTGTTDTGGGQTPASADEGSSREAALVASATVRVRGHGARRVVEIRLRLARNAKVSTLLRRNRTVLTRRQFGAPAGSSVLRLRVGRRTKAGPATLSLTHRPDSGQPVKATYRLRLPR
jgi:hypothetical protein